MQLMHAHRRKIEEAIHAAEHPRGMSTHDGMARIDASILRRLLAIVDSITVPEGWQLVPVEPTREMLSATSWPSCAATDYKHMLAAAPSRETAMSNDQPPLPQSFTILSRLQSGTEEVVSLDIVREYGRACERAAYERAMEACMITCAKNHADATTFRSVTKAYVAGCDDCHDAIRTLGDDK